MKTMKGKEMNQRKSLTSNDCLLFLAIIYVAVAVTMNIFCMKSLSFGSPIIICDGGLLVSWGVFLISNIIVEVWDEETSMKIITFAAIVSFALMIIGRIIVFIPSLDEYQEQSDAFARIFSNGPRTIIASVIAFWCGNFINVDIIAKIKDRIERKSKDNKVLFFFRASFSTLIGQLVDNLLFMVLAFAPIGLTVYEMYWRDIISSVLSGTVIELVVESCFVPFITIPITARIKRIKDKEGNR